MPDSPKEFVGSGTILISDIVNVAKLVDSLSPEELVVILNHYLDNVIRIIENYSGNILQFQGDAVFAYWSTNDSVSNHAQLAFNASYEILQSMPTWANRPTSLTYDIAIALGTGSMAGSFFGPQKKFQVIGETKAIADRLLRHNTLKYSSSITVSQYTVELLPNELKLEQSDSIQRPGSDDLQVYTYQII